MWLLIFFGTKSLFCLSIKGYYKMGEIIPSLKKIFWSWQSLSKPVILFCLDWTCVFLFFLLSETKFTRFKKKLVSFGHSKDKIDQIQCPIGYKKYGKHPQQIALGVVVNWMERNHQVQKGLILDQKIAWDQWHLENISWRDRQQRYFF